MKLLVTKQENTIKTDLATSKILDGKRQLIRATKNIKYSASSFK